MNSCLYKCNVMHNRLEPKPNRFNYNVFMFYLDLDEIDYLSKKLFFLSRNRFNIFNFRDKDHLQLPKENPDKTKNTKQHILAYLKENGIEKENLKIMLLTNLCTFGYQFNPVSFYFCFDAENVPICAISEVGNTFLEQKPYFIGTENLLKNKFHLNTEKNFYVSPFIDLDTHFDFNLQVPDEKLNIRIDDFKNQQRIFISTLTGKKKALNNRNLIWYSIRFPLITVQIIFLIHFQAIILWFKKINFHRKKDFIELQKGVYKTYQK